MTLMGSRHLRPSFLLGLPPVQPNSCFIPPPDRECSMSQDDQADTHDDGPGSSLDQPVFGQQAEYEAENLVWTSNGGRDRMRESVE